MVKANLIQGENILFKKKLLKYPASLFSEGFTRQIKNLAYIFFLQYSLSIEHCYIKVNAKGYVNRIFLLVHTIEK